MEKERKLMILYYAKDMEKQLVGWNKEQSIGAIEKENFEARIDGIMSFP